MQALSLTSGGAITQTGAIDVNGSTANIMQGRMSITLDNAGNDCNRSGESEQQRCFHVVLTDANALDLGTVGVWSACSYAHHGGAITDTARWPTGDFVSTV